MASPLKLPPGATLVDDGSQSQNSQMKLPPGATLIDDQSSAAQPASPQSAPPPNPPVRGFISRAWDWANKGLISGDQLLRGASLMYGTPSPEEIEAAAQPRASDSPLKAGLRTFATGALRDMADTASSFTSPASVALLGAGEVGAGARAGSTLAKAARGVQAAAGATYGVQGAKQIYDAATDNSQPLPDRIQRGLIGGAMFAGGAAGATDAAPRGIISKVIGDKTAPAAVEGALGVRAPDRAHLQDKSAIGRSVLNDLSANKPEDILEQANSKITEYGNQLNDLADKSTKRVSLAPAFDALDQIESTAASQNSAQELKIVKKIRDQLTTRASDGKTLIPIEPTAREVLDLKRGIGKLKSWDSPAQAALAGPIVDQVYGAIDGALDKALPGSEGINQKLSAMMKVAKRAEDLTNQAPVEQKGFARFAAHTGVQAAPTILGGTVGGAIGGGPGAAIGTGVGYFAGPFIQEAIASPAGRIRIARLLNEVGTSHPAAIPARISPGVISSAMAARRRR